MIEEIEIEIARLAREAETKLAEKIAAQQTGDLFHGLNAEG